MTPRNVPFWSKRRDAQNGSGEAAAGHDGQNRCFVYILLNKPMISKRAMSDRRIDPSWRKARIAARILLRQDQGSMTRRDIRIASRLEKDPGVTNRLIDQALASFAARRKRCGQPS
jgi:hypothetical protein